MARDEGGGRHLYLSPAAAQQTSFRVSSTSLTLRATSPAPQPSGSAPQRCPGEVQDLLSCSRDPIRAALPPTAGGECKGGKGNLALSDDAIGQSYKGTFSTRIFSSKVCLGLCRVNKPTYTLTKTPRQSIRNKKANSDIPREGKLV